MANTLQACLTCSLSPPWQTLPIYSSMADIASPFMALILSEPAPGFGILLTALVWAHKMKLTWHPGVRDKLEKHAEVRQERAEEFEECQTRRIWKTYLYFRLY